MSASASNSAKKADYAAKSAAWKQNVVNSMAAGRDEQRQIMNQQMQEQSKTTQKKHVSFLEEAQKVATAEVQAASANVAGLSVDNILADLSGKAALNRTYADENYRYIVADTTEKLKGTDTRIMARINSMERPVSPADTSGIEIMGAGVKAFAGLSGGLGLGG
jgi:hypothetical protein